MPPHFFYYSAERGASIIIQNKSSYDNSALRRAALLFVPGNIAALFASFLTLRDSSLSAAAAISLIVTAAAAASFLYALRGSSGGRSGRYYAAAFAVCLALSARVLLFDYETGDYLGFLKPWTDFFRQNGGLAALRYEVGNYNVPYLVFLALFSYLPVRELYLIKTLSVISDLALAAGLSALVRSCGGSAARSAGTFCVSILLPTVFLNSSVWGQCDGIYAALAVWALYFALSEKPSLSMLLFGLSFSFKLQSVFVLPIIFALLVSGRIKPRHIPLFPAAYLAAVSPALAAGRELKNVLLIYVSQGSGTTEVLNYNSPSLFSLPFNPADRHSAALTAVAAAFLFCALMCAVFYRYRKKITPKAAVLSALIFSIAVPLILPHMHERYFYLADALSLAAAFIFPSGAVIAPLVSFASLICYYAYLAQRWLIMPYWGFAAILTALIICLVRLPEELIKDAE